MTLQTTEKLEYNQKNYQMFSEPLNEYIEQNNITLPKIGISTCCWRGYIGYWKIENNQLFLNQVVLQPLDQTMNMITLFADYNDEPYFCDWFSGEIYCGDFKDKDFQQLSFDKGLLKQTKSYTEIEFANLNI